MAGTAVRLDALSTALGSRCVKAVGAPSRALMFIFYVLSVQAISKVKNTQIKCFFNDKLKDTDSFNCGTREKPVRCFSVTVSPKHTASMRTDTSSYASLISHIVVFRNETAVILLYIAVQVMLLATVVII